MLLSAATTVLITGAGSGIGRSLTVQAAALNARVIATDINATALAATRQLSGNRTETHLLDVADAGAIDRFAARIVPSLAGQPLVLVNNAGVGLASGPFSETDLTDFEWLLSINLWGVIRMTKAFMPYLLQTNTGHIVNVSSVFGLAGVEHQSAYCTAKFGVRGFTETLRMELTDTGVGVTCVHPGGIKTNIARNGRIGAGGFVTPAMQRQGAVSFDKTAQTTPDEAARQIWRGISHNKTRVLIGSDARQIDWITRLFPVGYTKMLRAELQKAFATTPGR
jgi:NAD(P)-dependent dehydrogenase (short-subunit alcohol dehydrogenase family)